MNKKWLTFIILLLLAINMYTLTGFHRFKQQYAGISQISENDELHTLKLNFWANIENSRITLEEIVAKDSLNNVLPLSDIWKNGRKQMLVCRFSESHCESCVNFSIQSVLHRVGTIGKEHVLFLGHYRNNRIFNKTKPLYHIHNLNTYNAAELNIPAESLGFPYYFVLNDDLTVSNVFIPDKATPEITDNYLTMINKRYFAKE